MIVLFILLLVTDLLTKMWAERALAERPIVLIENVFELRYLENRGAAFGILQDARIFFLITTVLFLAAAGYVFWRMPRTRAYILPRVLLTVVISGAVGNLIDRVMLGYVRDFLYFSLIDFPIFNVADCFVVVSVFVFAFFYLFRWPDDYFDFLKRSQKP